MEIVPFIYNVEDELLSNTYVVIDSHKECVVIDPSSDYDGIVNYIKSNSLKLKGILITHSHFDHIGGVNRLVKAFSAPIYAGYEDIPGFTDGYKNCSEGFAIRPLIISHEIKPLGDNEVLHLLDEDIKVIYTPYHTIGSVCYYFDKSKLLFSGDSLFMYAYGRSDLPTSVPNKREESITKLMKLSDEVKVYPGHGRFTTIGNERKFIFRHGHMS